MTNYRFHKDAPVITRESSRDVVEPQISTKEKRKKVLKEVFRRRALAYKKLSR